MKSLKENKSSTNNIENTERSESLDGLRGIAVLFVFLSHSSGAGFVINKHLNFHGIGHIGVYLFFILSAFLLGKGLFLKENNWQNIREFYIKRFFRIAPLYYLIVFIIYLFQINGYLYQLNGNYNTSYLHIKDGYHGYLYHLLFIRGDSVMWSIITEMQFYVIAPVLVYFIIKFKENAIIAIGLISLSSFLIYIGDHLYGLKNLKYISPNLRKQGMYLDVFSMGLFVAYLSEKKKDFISRNKSAIIASANILFPLIIFCSLIFVSSNFLGFDRPFYKFRFLSIMFGIVFALFVLSLNLGNSFGKYLENKFLRTAGILGYSIYMLHMAVFKVINMFEFSPFINFVIAIIGVFGVSYISYHLIEKKSIEFSHRLIKKLRERRSRLTPSELKL